MDEAQKRAQMPAGSAPVLEYRSLAQDYRTVIPILSPGMRVLDIGCGPGAISQGIAELVGPDGTVVGIDDSLALIERGKTLYPDIPNLALIHADLFEYAPTEKFDLIVAARVLQWLKNPLSALQKIKSMLKPGGILSILDYDHTQLEWQPEPPQSMQDFYQAFLKWRSDAGMNNQIAADLPGYFAAIEMEEIEVIDSNEVYRKGDANFLPKIGIWTKVAESRGKQLVQDQYIREIDRETAITEYKQWIATDAQKMVMTLKEIRGMKK